MALSIFNDILSTISEHELAESDIAFRVAQRIDFLMRKNSVSKSDLARGLDKDPAQISRWMSGEHNFSIKTLAQLELFFKEQILVSPTAAEEVDEYTQYVEQQAVKKRAKEEYEKFKAHPVNAANQSLNSPVVA